MNKRCARPGCASYAFSLQYEGIDQGDLCDVHYWQARAEIAEATVKSQAAQIRGYASSKASKQKLNVQQH
jgi:hypothetical protein